MAIIPYLAMTAAEMGSFSGFGEKIAWMACHFSPYSTGISNLPGSLPENAILILNDIIPIHGHDPERIAGQLAKCIETNHCLGLLLDFQRPETDADSALAEYLAASLPCPVVHEKAETGPVFMPITPCHVPLQEHISAVKDRDIWLEVGLEGECLTLTPSGCQIHSLSAREIPEKGLKEEVLHCHYHIELAPSEARFLLWRTKEDLWEQLEEAQDLGIQTAVGLWQELK